MLVRLCQLKSLLLLLLILSSCARWNSQKKFDAPNELISMMNPQWFKPDGEHSLIGQNGTPEPHLFFDVDPEFSKDNRQVNVVITTPHDSAHKYQLDILSGQRHYAYSYCKEKRHPFSFGYIPRMLDQLGTPQKVIIFGDPNKVTNVMSYTFFRIKLVGAYVERSCPEGDCEINKNWFSRLVFIGVDIEDKRYKEVNELSDFVSRTPWIEMKATLENLDGKNVSGLRTFPFIQVSPTPLPFSDAFEFFKKHSIFLSESEMKKIQTGCFSLYEKLWTEVGVERPEDHPAKTIEELSARVKLREEIRKKNLPVGFAERFKAFTRKYYDESVTCNKFVFAGNLNKNPEKFWFLNHMLLFYRLHRDGFYFDCHHNSWQRNVFDTRGKPVYDIKQDIDRCDEKKIDVAMAYISNFLEGLKGQGDEYYRFIDYDNHVFGTHNKLYSWVRIPSKKFECKESDPNPVIKKEMRVYPEDVKWKERRIRDIESQLKIIY